MKRLLFSLLLFGLLLLSACASIPVTGGGATPSAVPPTSTPAAAATPTDMLGHSIGDITLADAGQTITLHVGDSFLLKLGTDDNWSPVVADQSILSRVPNVMVIRGAQGIYKAHAPGKTQLNASGEPACRQENPPCAQPSRQFMITIQVLP